MKTGEFEDVVLSSSMPEQSSMSTLVAMIASQVVLLLMLAACSPCSR